MADTTYTVTMQELDEIACHSLLGRVHFGRVAFESDDRISILPVNAVVVPRAGHAVVYFRTARGSPLHRLGDSSPVAFEADHHDHVAESGWSVLVRGFAAFVDDDEILVALAETRTHPWAPGERDCWIGITAETVTGRRIERHADLRPGEHLPYMPPD
jgi:uncharacterized protein